MTSSAPRPRHITGAPASTITVRVAEPPDRLIAITVLVGAFSVPPLAGWIDPNSMTRYGYLIEHVAPLVSDAITRSAVYLATDAGQMRAAALWTPRRPYRHAPPPRADTPPARRLHLLAELSAAAQPDTDHETLIVAGRGADLPPQVLAAVLAPRVQTLDQDGRASFTVATSPGLQIVLAGCGFRPYGPPITLPDSTIVLRPMHRTARAVS